MSWSAVSYTHVIQSDAVVEGVLFPTHMSWFHSSGNNSSKSRDSRRGMSHTHMSRIHSSRSHTSMSHDSRGGVTTNLRCVAVC